MTRLREDASPGAACPIPAPKKSMPCSIHVPLYEHETGSDDFSSWPQAVQNIHTREIDAWAWRNPDMDIVEQTHTIDVVRRVTVTEWQYARKAVAA